MNNRDEVRTRQGQDKEGRGQMRVRREGGIGGRGGEGMVKGQVKLTK